MLGAAMLPATGCRSDWIDVTVENRTGQPIRELEVDYPTASFGFDAVAAGAQKKYRLQVRGRGQVQVAYTLPEGKTPHAKGPELVEHESGGLTILLLPGGKVDFQPRLQPAT